MSLPQTRRFFNYSLIAFALFWVLQHLFGVREANANEVARWVIGAGKALAIFGVLVFGILWAAMTVQQSRSGAEESENG